MGEIRAGSASASELNRGYYERLSPGQEDYWRKMAAPRFRVSVIRREVRRLAPKRLADLGCGNGALLEELARMDPELSLAGLDLSPSQIAANRERLPRVAWHCLDLAESLPEKRPGPFDVTVASEIIEHVEAPERFLASARALTAGGGHLVLSTQSGPLRETERRVGHVRHFSREAMSDLLVASGFTPLRVWNCGFPFHDLSKWYANLDPDRSMARFGDRPYGASERAIAFLLRIAFTLNSGRRGAQLFAVARRETDGKR